MQATIRVIDFGLARVLPDSKALVQNTGNNDMAEEELIARQGCWPPTDVCNRYTHAHLVITIVV